MYPMNHHNQIKSGIHTLLDSHGGKIARDLPKAPEVQHDEGLLSKFGHGVKDVVGNIIGYAGNAFANAATNYVTRRFMSRTPMLP